MSKAAPNSGWLGPLIAWLMPLVWLLPALPAHTPIVQAAWEATPLGVPGTLLSPVFEALARALPVGSLELRQALLAAMAVCALAAALHALLDGLLARFLMPLARAPFALGLAWALLSRLLVLEPVLMRAAPLALCAAIVVGCVAMHVARRNARIARYLKPSAERQPTSLLLAAALSLMAVGALLVRSGAQDVAAIRSEAFETLRDALIARAAPRALLIAPDALARQAEPHLVTLRPDMDLLRARDVLDASLAERLSRARPELTGLVRASLLRGELDPLELQQLAAHRPVRVALELSAFNGLRAVLIPASFGADVATSHVTANDLRVALDAHAPRSAELFSQLALGELDAAGRAFVREQCVLTAALLSDLARGSLLGEYLDRAALFTRGPDERAALARSLPVVGIPAVFE